uniref:Uncharacterized protein n=1 Tax=Meloidogyne incognita TaxID=6306 RepID=A0A914MID6_MELIC
MEWKLMMRMMIWGLLGGLDEEEEEDDLGLLPPGPPSRHFGNYEEEEEDDEIGLNRMPPMPDEEDDIFGDPKTSTPAPQDPTINNENVNYDMMNVPFKDFAKEVVYTVASKPIGYCNVHELREDLSTHKCNYYEWTGLRKNVGFSDIFCSCQLRSQGPLEIGPMATPLFLVESGPSLVTVFIFILIFFEEKILDCSRIMLWHIMAFQILRLL